MRSNVYFPSKTMVRFKVTVNEPATPEVPWPQQSYPIQLHARRSYSLGVHNIRN